MRLAQKFTAALVVVITLALGARGIVDTRRATERYRDRVHSAQQQLGDVLELSVTRIWEAEGWERALAFLKRVEGQQGDLQIRWVWLDEKSQEEYLPIVPLDTIRHGLIGSKSISFDGSVLPGYLVTYKPVSLANLPLGAVEITRSTAESEAYIRAEMRRQGVIGLLVLLVYALVASVLGRRLIGQPIDALVGHAQRVAGGDFASVSHIPQRDEIGRLGLEMNRMSERLHIARERARKEYEARLEIEEQLTHADRLSSVGRITAAIIHDLGTPLNVISGRASMIAEGDLPSDQIPGAARKISDQAMRIGEMVREVLTFARRGQLDREPTVVVDLAREVAHLVQPVADKSRVKIEVRPPPSRVLANVNRTQLRQVFMNLIMNGIQAMPDGGEIAIEVEADDGDRLVRIRVMDTGPGIPDDVREEIFKPFFTTKSEREGTGLGLSVCKSIVEHHGGTISVDSRVGEGTRFTVWLPREGGTPS